MDEKCLKFEWRRMLLCALEVPRYCFDFVFFLNITLILMNKLIVLNSLKNSVSVFQKKK